MNATMHPPVPEHRPDVGDPIWEGDYSHIVTRVIASKGGGRFAVEASDDHRKRYIHWDRVRGWITSHSWTR